MPKTEPFEKNVQQYEAWFRKYHFVYTAELKAVRALLPKGGDGIEVGVGTGRFAALLGIHFGVEPAGQMAKIAMRRGVRVVCGAAEALPLDGDRFDFVLMVTTVCFLDDLERAFGECYRLLKKKGVFIVGFVDRSSPLGQIYLKHQNDHVFYKDALFYTVDEIMEAMQQTGFRDFDSRQTIFGDLNHVTPDEPVTTGHGDGAFVVVRARR